MLRREELVTRLTRAGWEVVLLGHMPEHTARQKPWAVVCIKSKPAYFRRYQEHVHGVGFVFIEKYQQLARTSGRPVALFILEQRSNEVIWGMLDELALRAWKYDGDKQDPGGMMYFPRPEFDVWNGEAAPLPVQRIAVPQQQMSLGMR